MSTNKRTLCMAIGIDPNTIGLNYLTFEKFSVGDVMPNPSEGYQGFVVIINNIATIGCMHFYAPDGKQLAHFTLSELAVYTMASATGTLLDPIMDKLARAWGEDPEQTAQEFTGCVAHLAGIVAKAFESARREKMEAQAKDEFPEDDNLDEHAATVTAALSKHVH